MKNLNNVTTRYSSSSSCHKVPQKLKPISPLKCDVIYRRPFGEFTWLFVLDPQQALSSSPGSNRSKKANLTIVVTNLPCLVANVLSLEVAQSWAVT